MVKQTDSKFNDILPVCYSVMYPIIARRSVIILRCITRSSFFEPFISPCVRPHTIIHIHVFYSHVPRCMTLVGMSMFIADYFLIWQFTQVRVGVNANVSYRSCRIS